MAQRALAPAKVESVEINEEKKSIAVYLKPDQVSLAIGKRGLNIKLAGKLVGYEIEVFRDTDDAGWTEVHALNGGVTGSVDADGVCDGT
jgi:transcription antitermination factor NusA-like protein